MALDRPAAGLHLPPIDERDIDEECSPEPQFRLNHFLFHPPPPRPPAESRGEPVPGLGVEIRAKG